MFMTITTTQAMTYAQAREQALFLTDKMAYELNLTQEQYEAAYEINLDYLMAITGTSDVYAMPWRQRNIDLSYILYDWQYAAYEAASYFFRPVFWNAGYWHFGIYSHYPHRTYYYFARPAAYNVYRGGHSWRRNSGRSWYVNRIHHYRPAIGANHRYSGLRDMHHNNNRNNGGYNNGARIDNRSNGVHRNDNGNYRNNDNRNYNYNRNSNNNNRYNGRNNSFGNNYNNGSSSNSNVNRQHAGSTSSGPTGNYRSSTRETGSRPSMTGASSTRMGGASSSGMGTSTRSSSNMGARSSSTHSAGSHGGGRR